MGELLFELLKDRLINSIIKENKHYLPMTSEVPLIASGEVEDDDQGENPRLARSRLRQFYPFHGILSKL